MIISRTPLRVSLFGGGSDIAAHYRSHGGAVLSTAVNKAVYVTVSQKFDDAVRVSYSRTEEVAHASQIEHPLVREALALLDIEGGIEITSVADIPAKGTGLGSSSTFTVGLLNALHAYRGRAASAEQLAREACHVEIERCGEPIGKQDQYAAAFGGFNLIRFNPDDTVEVKKLICEPATLADLQDRLLFFYTGMTRSASALLSELSAGMAQGGKTAQSAGRLVEMAEHAYGHLCTGRVSAIGALLDEAWSIKRSMHSGISSPMIDASYAAAIAAGAEGGKLLGAGGGGFLMFLAPPERHPAIRQALAHLRETPMRFAPQGSSIIFVH